MKAIPVESGGRSEDAPVGLRWRLALKWAYVREAAEYRVQTYGRKGWRALKRLERSLSQSG